MKKTAKDFFQHSKKERTSASWLIFLAAGIAAIPFLVAFFGRGKITEPKYENEIAELQLTAQKKDSNETAYVPFERNYTPKQYDKRDYNDASNYQSPTEKENLNAALFQFDPNTLDVTGWQRLGLTTKQANTINNYRSKGGKFYKAEDIKRIWGISPELADRIIPYAAVANTSANNYTKNTNTNEPAFSSTPAKKAPENISLNNTDTTALKTLPGIGSKLSARILAYRDKLGGFYAVEQVKEVYGIEEEVFQNIKPYLNADAAAVKKISINSASSDQLKNHPYIKYNLAKVIVAYRDQHGKFNDADDLKKIVAMDEATVQKLVPYLSFE